LHLHILDIVSRDSHNVTWNEPMLLLIVPDELGGLVAVHDGHGDVHKHHNSLLVLGELHILFISFFSVISFRRSKLERIINHQSKDIYVQIVVINYED